MKHSHYKKDVSHLQFIDVYRTLQLFGVTDNAIGHAIKKLLCAGQRGAKTQEQDIREAVDTMNRWLQMQAEDCNAKPATPTWADMKPGTVRYPETKHYPYLAEVAAHMNASAEAEKAQRAGLDDGWIEWGGGNCPVDGQAMVRVRLRGNRGEPEQAAGTLNWRHDVDGYLDIIAYRVVTA